MTRSKKELQQLKGSLFLTDSSSTENEIEEKADDQSQKKNLLPGLSAKSRKYTEKTEGIHCNWGLVKKLMIISFLMVAYFLCNIAFSTIAPFFPKEGAKIGVSSAMIGVIIGVCPLCVAIISPAVGYLLPQVGFQLPILLGLLQVGTSYVLLGQDVALHGRISTPSTKNPTSFAVVGCFSFILLGHSLSYKSFDKGVVVKTERFVNLLPTWAFILTSFFLRTIEGVGTAFFYTASFAVFPIFFPHNVGTLVGLFEVAAGLGYGIGLPIGGALYEAGGYKLPFITIGSAVLLFSIPCTVLVSNINSIDKPKRLPTKATLFISTDMIVIALVFSIIMGSAGFTYNHPIIQPFLMNEFHYGTIVVAVILLTGPIVCMTVNTIVGPLVDKIGCNRGFIIFGLILGGLSCFVMGVLYASGIMSPIIVIASLIVHGFASVFETTPVYGDILKTTSRKYLRKDDSKDALVSFISGLVVSAYFFGEFFGSLVGGALHSFVSYPITAIIVGEMILAEALLLFGVTMIDSIGEQPSWTFSRTH